MLAGEIPRVTCVPFMEIRTDRLLLNNFFGEEISPVISKLGLPVYHCLSGIDTICSKDMHELG